MAGPASAQNIDLNARLRSMILENSQTDTPKNANTNTPGRGRAYNVRVRGNDRQAPPTGRGQLSSIRGNSPQVQARSNSTTGPSQVRPERGNHHGPPGWVNRGPDSWAMQNQQRSNEQWRAHAPKGAGPPQPVPNSNPGSGGAMNTQGPGRNGFRGNGTRSRPSSYAPLSRPQRLSLDELRRQCNYLESLLTQEMSNMGMSDQEYAEKNVFRARLEVSCQKVMQGKYHGSKSPQLQAFGSFASSFSMPGSDMDLALVTPHVPDDFPRMLERELLDAGLGARLLTRTRVPIMKVCEKPSPDLYSALCEERQKWDAMTAEERDTYDNSTRHDDATDPQKDKDTARPASIEAQPIEPGGREIQSTDATRHTSNEKPMVDSDDTKDVESASKQTSPPTDHQKSQTLEEVVAGLNESNEAARIPTNDQQSKPQPTSDSTITSPKPQPRPPRKERPWLRERPTGPLDFPKHPPNNVGIQADINFSTMLGLHNTALLRCYAASDPRVRPMVLFIKRWASARKINSSYNGTLSSYGYVLMVLHVLVNVARPFVCQNLQLSATHKAPPTGPPGWKTYTPPAPNDSNAVCDGCDIRFWCNEAELARLASKGFLTQNREGRGALLRLFFLYFAQQGPMAPAGGFAWTQEVLSLRTPGGLLHKQDKGWTGAKTTLQGASKTAPAVTAPAVAVQDQVPTPPVQGGHEVASPTPQDPGNSNNMPDKTAQPQTQPQPQPQIQVRHRYLFAIEDPFETDHNVARTVTHHGIVAIRDEFRRVARILARVGRGFGADGSQGGEGGVLDEIVEEKGGEGQADEKGGAKEVVTAPGAAGAV